jgi:hypothetical protein
MEKESRATVVHRVILSLLLAVGAAIYVYGQGLGG